MPTLNNDSNKPENNTRAAQTGNASNPAPGKDIDPPGNKNQLIDEKGEKYMRESGNIEDMPDATDLEEAERTMDEKNKIRRAGKDDE